MKKTILTIFITLICVVAGAGRARAAEIIHDFRSTIHINTNGTIDVAETIVYDFDYEDRHGIFRDIPDTITNLQGKRFQLDFNKFSVTDESGKPYKFQESSDTDYVHLKIGDPNRTLNGLHTYVIKYTVSGALQYFSEHDELYWNATGDQWKVNMEDAQSIVTLPSQVGGSQLKMACYTGVHGSTAANCSFHTDQSTGLYFSASRVLSPGEGMTIVVGFPKGLVAVVQPKPVFWDTPLGRVVKGILAGLWYVVLALWYAGLPLYIIINWFRNGRDPKPEIGVVHAGFDPPKRQDGTPLSPAETGALLDETVDQRDISAMLVDLARRGYLRIEERKKKDFYFVRTNSKEKKPLDGIEKSLLDSIFSDGETEVRLQDLKYQLYDTVARIKKDMYERLVSDGFFPKNPETTRNIYLVVGLVGLFTGNILLFIAAVLFGRQMPRKTLLGSDAKSVAQSLKNFLSSQERELQFQAKNQMVFEKLLPYAIAFGVEKIWAERFKDIDLKQPSWYTGYDSSAHFNSVYLINSIGNTYSGMAAASASVSSTGSSSGFGGGGFSGGGGGGGGGGSW